MHIIDIHTRKKGEKNKTNSQNDINAVDFVTKLELTPKLF